MLMRLNDRMASMTPDFGKVPLTLSRSPLCDGVTGLSFFFLFAESFGQLAT